MCVVCACVANKCSMSMSNKCSFPVQVQCFMIDFFHTIHQHHSSYTSKHPPPVVFITPHQPCSLTTMRSCTHTTSGSHHIYINCNAAMHPGLLSDGSPAPDPKDWRGTKLMQLLKRASKRYGSKGLSLGISSETPPTSADAANASTAALGQAAGQLVAQAKAMQQQLQGQESDKLIESEFGLEALLRRTEQALTLAGHEADRSRLVPVAAALVDLGADVYAVDNEGRTALHLAAGCGDKSMVARLVELGSDVGAKDSVGGRFFWVVFGGVRW